MKIEINDLCKLSHKIAKENGFWENKEIPTKLMLIVTELGEACEAHRNGENEHFHEEIADVFIRLSDLCGYLDIDIERVILDKTEINKKRPHLHGKLY